MHISQTYTFAQVHTPHFVFCCTALCRYCVAFVCLCSTNVRSVATCNEQVSRSISAIFLTVLFFIKACTLFLDTPNTVLCYTINTTLICTRKPKNLCDLLCGGIRFIAVIWSQATLYPRSACTLSLEGCTQNLGYWLVLGSQSKKTRVINISPGALLFCLPCVCTHTCMLNCFSRVWLFSTLGT